MNGVHFREMGLNLTIHTVEEGWLLPLVWEYLILLVFSFLHVFFPHIRLQTHRLLQFVSVVFSTISSSPEEVVRTLSSGIVVSYVIKMRIHRLRLCISLLGTHVFQDHVISLSSTVCLGIYF